MPSGRSPNCQQVAGGYGFGTVSRMARSSKATRSVSLVAVERKILLVRGHRVLLDAHLANLYGVETRALLQAVKRNSSRFPQDFMIRLDAEEATRLRSQFVISNARGGRRYAPYVFTEQGVAMLSSVLKSPRAIQVNIQIMRAFVRLREMLATHAELLRKIKAMERKYDGPVHGGLRGDSRADVTARQSTAPPDRVQSLTEVRFCRAPRSARSTCPTDR